MLVLEAAPAPGGGVSSGELTLPGFVHDRCASFFPVTRLSPAMRAQELERHGVEWISPRTAMAHPFEDGSAIELAQDLEATVASLEAAAPGAGAAWSELARRLIPLREEIAEAVFSRLAPAAPLARLAVRLRRDGLLLARRGLGSVQALGEQVFGASRPTAWLAGSAMHSGLAPGAGGSAAFGLLLTLMAHWVSWPFPRGGAQRVTDALVARLRELGGDLRLDARVDAIDVRGGRVAGVRLAGGETVSGSAVVATVSPGALLPLLPDRAFPERLLGELRRWRYGPGAFKVDFALSAPVPWTAEAARRAGVVHVAGEFADLARPAQAAARGETPERPLVVVGQHTPADPTRAPEGRHTLYAYGHAPARLGVPEDEFADRIQAQIERFAPGFGDVVLARTARPPAQIERDNPSMVGGDLSSGSFELDQQLVFRPAPELCRGRTPLRGLYVAGAAVHPGPAVHGASGAAAARSLIEDRSALRPWRRA